jgi:hypothetical protein
MRNFWSNPSSIPNQCSDTNAVTNFPEAWKQIGPRSAALVEAKHLNNFMAGMSQPRNIGYTVTAVSSNHESCDMKEVLGRGNTGNQLPANINLTSTKRLENYPNSIQQTPKKVLKSTNFSYRYNNRSYRLRNSSFAPLSADNNSLLRNPRHEYNGCGRHAAYHVTTWLGLSNSFHDVSRRMTPVYIPFQGREQSDGSKATMPNQVRNALNQIFVEQNLPIEAYRRRNATRPQDFIEQHIRNTGPVIALVRNGSHYLTAMGYWQPILTTTDGYFWGFNNGISSTSYNLYARREFSLNFSRHVKRFEKGSWREGTVIHLRAKSRPLTKPTFSTPSKSKFSMPSKPTLKLYIPKN